jgi:hypothetical protein
MLMKLPALFLLLSTAALAQGTDTPKIVTFNPADKEHCKVGASNGKPVLESTFNGTTVAVTMPQNWGNGEFSVLVTVAQVGAGQAEVNPKEVSAVYPDPDHTRFRWFDKGHELDTQASMRAAGMVPGGGPAGPAGAGVGDSSSAAPPPNHPERTEQRDPHVGERSGEENRQLQLRNGAGNGADLPGIDPMHPPVFLKHATVKAGATAAGYVFIRKPKGAQIEVTGSAMLDEIDIPVSGIIFRF